MKRTDLSPDRQKLLAPISSHPGAYGLVPPPTPLHLSLPRLRGEITRAHEALGRLQAATTALPHRNLVTRTFDRREAVRSSQIEGTGAELDDLCTYEATGSGDGLPPDVLVTMNYVKALEYGLQEVSRQGISALTISLMEGLHVRLMEGVKDYSDIPGQIRTRQNWIRGFRIYDAKFVPPPHEYVRGCLEDLVRALQHKAPEESFFETPLVMRMAIAHAQFETIHPFIDGNGRVGRILLPLMLAAEGYPPVYLAGFLKANTEVYFDTLYDVQLRGEWTEWVRFLAIGIERACQETIETANGLTAIHERWKKAVVELHLRADAAAHRLPEFLIGNPVVTVNHVATGLKVAFPAANRALIQLQKAGIVEPMKEQKRNRVFVAREVINLLDRPTILEMY